MMISHPKKWPAFFVVDDLARFRFRFDFKFVRILSGQDSSTLDNILQEPTVVQIDSNYEEPQVTFR